MHIFSSFICREAPPICRNSKLNEALEYEMDSNLKNTHRCGRRYFVLRLFVLLFGVAQEFFVVPPLLAERDKHMEYHPKTEHIDNCIHIKGYRSGLIEDKPDSTVNEIDKDAVYSIQIGLAFANEH